MEGKVSRENVCEFLFEKQLELIGKTRVDLIDSPNWKFYFTITREQFIEFKTYAIALIQKTFRCNRSKALNTFDWYWKLFEIRLKD